jgi:hypothetical protein
MLAFYVDVEERETRRFGGDGRVLTLALAGAACRQTKTRMRSATDIAYHERGDSSPPRSASKG